MKKFTKLFAVLAAACAAFAFTACDTKDGDTTLYPTISQEGTFSIDGDNYKGVFKVTCDATAKLDEDKLSAKYAYGNTTESVAKANISISKTEGKKEYDWFVTITFPQAVQEEAVKSLTVSAGVKNNGEKDRTFNIENTPAETDLEAAANFTAKRAGTTLTGDLGTFGLGWTKNITKATWAQITKDGASKMVKLTKEQWTSIKTKEALAAAISEGADMAALEDISADATADYEIVIGVANGDVNYLITFTKATVTSNTSGTTIEVTGQYKK